jgi:hypothetical protein
MSGRRNGFVGSQLKTDMPTGTPLLPLEASTTIKKPDALIRWKIAIPSSPVPVGGTSVPSAPANPK